MRRLLLWGGVILGIILLIALLSKFSAAPDSTENANSLLTPSSVAHENTNGNPDAKTELVEYSDFQCPGCAQMYPILKQLAEELGDSIKVEYLHFPIRQIHAQAQLAGQAAEAAGMQGKFWDMHDMIFNTQAQWADNEDAEKIFVSLAESLGLDIEQFKIDLHSDAAEDKVNKDYTNGLRSRVQGTPTLFLNGKLIQFPGSYAALKRLVEAELGS